MPYEDNCSPRRAEPIPSAISRVRSGSMVSSGTDADVRGTEGETGDSGRRFITSEPIQDSGEGGQRGAHVGGSPQSCQLRMPSVRGANTVTNTPHRAALPVHQTQRDRAQSSPARRSGSDYGLVTGMKPDGVVAVTLGLATLVSGTGGGVVVVTVCSVACGATAPTTCAGSAELTSPTITPSAPMATTALAPRTADNHLTLFC